MASLGHQSLPSTDLGRVDEEMASQGEAITKFQFKCNLIEETVDFARQINLKVDSDDVQELLDCHNQERTIDELIEMHLQDNEEVSLDPVQLEDRMTAVNLTKRHQFN
ncbi:hypothetical protein TNCV_2759871 [Trichonephila clavipes]|nr:hypothetical protein TNCV_2759871 [Trichonephila clavipes]